MTVDISFSIPTNTLIIAISAIVFLADLALAWRIWISNRKNPINICFALTALMISFWVLSITLAERVFMDPLAISYAFRASYSSSTLLIFFFFLFTYHFPYKVYKLSRTRIFIILIITSLILVIAVLPNIFVSEYVLPKDRFSPEKSVFWHLFFAGYFFFISILAYYNLFSKLKSSSGIWRTRLKQVIIATSVAVIGGSFFCLIVPIIYSNTLDWVGPLFTLFMVVYIWYYIFWKSKQIPK